MDIDEQITGVPNVSIFVMEVVSIPGLYRDSEFCSGEVVLFNEISVYARDICAAINQCSDIDNFHQIRRNNKLNMDLH